MGTTVVSTLFLDRALIVGHVGDSRLYRRRDGVMKQLTEDHSLLNDYIKMKNLSADEIAAFPHKNVITRALGMRETVQVDVLAHDIHDQDIFLLCSDGLSGMVEDPKLLEVGRAFRCSEGQLWRNIVLPAALPFIVTGLRLALGRALIGMVLADLYTAISGIGYLIVRTASTYQVDKMFVPIVTLGLLGVTFTALLRLAEKYVAPWTSASSDD